MRMLHYFVVRLSLQNFILRLALTQVLSKRCYDEQSKYLTEAKLALQKTKLWDKLQFGKVDIANTVRVNIRIF